MENKDNFKCISILLWFVNTFFFIFITYYLLDYYELVDANENYNNQFNNTYTESNYTTKYSYSYIKKETYHTLYTNIYTISLYILFYLAITCIIFKHFIGILLANLFYISLILIIYIDNIILDCKNKYISNCDNNRFTHSYITEARNALLYFILGSVLFNMLFSSMVSIFNSKNKKYYISSFLFLETFLIFIGYYIFSIYFLVYPLLCCIGLGISNTLFLFFINGRYWSNDNFEIIA